MQRSLSRLILSCLASGVVMLGLSACDTDTHEVPTSHAPLSIPDASVPDYPLPTVSGSSRGDYDLPSKRIQLPPYSASPKPSETSKGKSKGDGTQGHESKAQRPTEPPKVSCRGKAGMDEGDLDRNGWIDPNEPMWKDVCKGT